MTDKTKSFLPAYLILGGLFLLRFLPLLFPDGRFWGFNHLLFLPPGWIIACAVISACALALPFIRSGDKSGIALATWFDNTFYKHPRKFVFRALSIALAGVCFTIFAASTHFLGDGYALLANLASSAGTYYLWTETAIINIIQIVQYAIGGPSEPNALLAFRIVAVVSGMVTILFVFMIAGIAGESPLTRLLLFFTSVGSGMLLLFFGYVENYPLLWAMYAGFVYFSLRCIRYDRGIIPALVFLLLTIAVHLQAAMFIPAFVYVMFAGEKGRALYHRLKYLWWGLATVIIIAGLIAFFKLYASNLYVENIFLPLLDGKPASPEYSLLSLPHLADIINELLLLSPLLPLLLILAGSHPFRALQSRLIVFLALNAVAGLAFLLAIDPQLAMPRDWDLFSLCACGLTLALLLALDRKKQPLSNRLVIPIILFLVTAPLPYLATNLNSRASAEYAKHVVNLDRSRSRGTLLLVKKYYANRGDKKQADSLNTLYGKYYPHVWQYADVFSFIKQGRRDLAMQKADQIKPDRFSKDYHNMWACVHFIHGDLQKALTSAKNSVQLQSYFDDSYLYLGMIYARLNQFDSALTALGSGFKLNRRNPRILQELAGIYLMKEQPDSSIYYGRLLLELQPQNPPALLTLARAYVRTGNLAETRRYAAMYQQYGRNDLNFERKLADLNRAIEALQQNRRK